MEYCEGLFRLHYHHQLLFNQKEWPIGSLTNNHIVNLNIMQFYSYLQFTCLVILATFGVACNAVAIGVAGVAVKVSIATNTARDDDPRKDPRIQES